MKKKNETENEKKIIYVNVHIDLSGGEEIVIPSMNAEDTPQIVNWIRGNAGQIFELVFSDKVYFINREFVTNVKFENVEG